MAESERPGGGRKSGWRDATAFKQGERYGADAQNGGAGSGPPSLTPVFIAGGVMVGSTILLRLLGAGSVLAFLLGIAAFIVTLIVVYERRDPGKPAPAQRAVAPGAGYDAEAVAAKLDGAEADLLAIDAAARKLPAGIRSALDDMTTSARQVLDMIAADPLDIDRARKFIVAYLPSARRAVEKYVDLGVRDSALDARFLALIDEMSQTCRRQQETLNSDNVFDLEIEIETLSERLQGER